MRVAGSAVAGTKPAAAEDALAKSRRTSRVSVSASRPNSNYSFVTGSSATVIPVSASFTFVLLSATG